MVCGLLRQDRIIKSDARIKGKISIFNNTFSILYIYKKDAENNFEKSDRSIEGVNRKMLQWMRYFHKNSYRMIARIIFIKE